MKDTYKAFDKAIKKLRDVSGELQKLLADSVASSIDVEDMTECIRNEAYPHVLTNAPSGTFAKREESRSGLLRRETHDSHSTISIIPI